jgi:CheY-like chemotaxis protein
MNLTTATVLVVDDDEASRELMDLVLAQEPGIYYAIAAGGANAIAKLSDGPPDVILTDLVMPRVNGREVIAFARKRYPGIPIIAFSAEPASQSVERDHKVDGEPVFFLRKPLDLTELVDLVRELAADRSWRAQPAHADMR